MTTDKPTGREAWSQMDGTGLTQEQEAEFIAANPPPSLEESLARLRREEEESEPSVEEIAEMDAQDAILEADPQFQQMMLEALANTNTRIIDTCVEGNNEDGSDASKD